MDSNFACSLKPAHLVQTKWTLDPQLTLQLNHSLENQLLENAPLNRCGSGDRPFLWKILIKYIIIYFKEFYNDVLSIYY